MYDSRHGYLILCLLAASGIGQFIVATGLAIHHYPGGSLIDDQSQGYSLGENFLSDLGRTRSWSDVDNSVSSRLFNRSVVALGVSLLPFMLVLPNSIEAGRQLIRVLGSMSVLGLIGIALTPYDLYLVAHYVALGAWLGPLSLLIVVYLGAAAVSRTLSWQLVVGTLLVGSCIAAYALAGSHNGYVVMQKLTVAGAIVWFALVSYRVTTCAVEQISDRQRLLERQATRYMNRLARGHRWSP